MRRKDLKWLPNSSPSSYCAAEIKNKACFPSLGPLSRLFLSCCYHFQREIHSFRSLCECWEIKNVIQRRIHAVLPVNVSLSLS